MNYPVHPDLPLGRPSFFDLEMQFADACDIYQGKVEGFEGVEQMIAIALAASLVTEEVNRELLDVELPKYIHNPSLENKAEVADGIADSIYVLCQLARAMGIPLNEVFMEVQRSNMAKVGPDGNVKRREDGKILKPDGWTPPNIWGVLKKAADQQAIELQRYGAENWPGAGEVIKKLEGN